MPAYTLNEDAVRHAKQLIDARQYVLRSRWQNVQPRAREQNAFLKTHPWDEYAAWHLGLTEDAAEQTKARYAFVYGDSRPTSAYCPFGSTKLLLASAHRCRRGVVNLAVLGPRGMMMPGSWFSERARDELAVALSGAQIHPVAKERLGAPSRP